MIEFPSKVRRLLYMLHSGASPRNRLTTRTACTSTQRRAPAASPAVSSTSCRFHLVSPRRITPTGRLSPIRPSAEEPARARNASPVHPSPRSSSHTLSPLRAFSPLRTLSPLRAGANAYEKWRAVRTLATAVTSKGPPPPSPSPPMSPPTSTSPGRWLASRLHGAPRRPDAWSGETFARLIDASLPQLAFLPEASTKSRRVHVAPAMEAPPPSSPLPPEPQLPREVAPDPSQLGERTPSEPLTLLCL